LGDKKILILSNNAIMLVPSLEKSLREAGSNLKFTFKTDYTFEEADLIFIDYSLYQMADKKYADVLNYRSKLAFLTALIDHIQVNKILRETHVSHLIGLSGPNSFSDIRDFIIAFFTGVKWTTDTIMKSAKFKTEKLIKSSEGMPNDIKDLLAGHDFSIWFEGLQDYLNLILNESINNALYNAPTDEMGNHTIRELNRKQPTFSIPGKEPLVTVTTDSKKVVISVKDFYGSLKTKEIFDFLPTGEVKEKEGGAGVGMYLIFKYVHKYIINIDCGKSTENIFVIEGDKRFKWYLSKEKSFHIF
jgi:sigma-B regulation protein RsbU (phosphoserine phosphatase)